MNRPLNILSPQHRWDLEKASVSTQEHCVGRRKVNSPSSRPSHPGCCDGRWRPGSLDTELEFRCLKAAVVILRASSGCSCYIHSLAADVEEDASLWVPSVCHSPLHETSAPWIHHLPGTHFLTPHTLGIRLCHAHLRDTMVQCEPHSPACPHIHSSVCLLIHSFLAHG